MDLTNEIISSTSPEEKSKRFDFINNQLMEKYFEFVWFARADPKKHKGNGDIELFNTIIAKLQEIADKYPKEIGELISDDTNWQHGFNSGVLAYARFLSSYLEDTLFPAEDDDDSDDIVEKDGKRYIQIDGRQDAFDSFPMLDT